MNNKKIKVCVCGAAGRMGKRVIAHAAEQDTLQITGACDVHECGCIGVDCGICAGTRETGVKITDDLAAACENADVVVDFALHEGFAARIQLYCATKTACVTGTTAIDTDAKNALIDAAKKIAIVHAPNFSVGVTVLCSLARQTAAALGEEYDIEVIEMHHRRKKDAPSGTAVRIVEEIEAGRATACTQRIYGREGVTGPRSTEEIGIHAVRGGGVIGDHTAVFAGEAERIELTHRAETRDVFACGALRAAHFIIGKAPGMYTMEHVLGLA